MTPYPLVDQLPPAVWMEQAQRNLKLEYALAEEDHDALVAATDRLREALDARVEDVASKAIESMEGWWKPLAQLVEVEANALEKQNEIRSRWHRLADERKQTFFPWTLTHDFYWMSTYIFDQAEWHGHERDLAESRRRIAFAQRAVPPLQTYVSTLREALTSASLKGTRD